MAWDILLVSLSQLSWLCTLPAYCVLLTHLLGGADLEEKERLDTVQVLIHHSQVCYKHLVTKSKHSTTRKKIMSITAVPSTLWDLIPVYKLTLGLNKNGHIHKSAGNRQSADLCQLAALFLGSRVFLVLFLVFLMEIPLFAHIFISF